MKLNELAERPGSKRLRKRVGRGPGSGIGKTCGRGLKGQKSRSGVSINGFEGGQMPIYMRLPKRGFNSRNSKKFALVNLGILQSFIDRKKIDPKKEITEEVLLGSGMVTRKLDGVKILGKGTLTSKIMINVTGVSKGAVSVIEKLGGSCLTSK